jgi:hypothetical protein
LAPVPAKTARIKKQKTINDFIDIQLIYNSLKKNKTGKFSTQRRVAKTATFEEVFNSKIEILFHYSCIHAFSHSCIFLTCETLGR